MGRSGTARDACSGSDVLGEPRDEDMPMKSAGKRRLVVLGAASALATAGIVWLAVAAFGRAPQWVTAAAGSPLAVRCIVLMVGGVAVLGLVAALLIRVRPRAKPPQAGLHTDQGGTAAVEMALLFPFAVMIFLTIIQAALLFNANMVVHYAAFAAARMATVVVPMEINDESRNCVYSPEQGISEKREMIRRAAVLALVPISAKLDMPGIGFGDDFLPGAEDLVAGQAQRAMGLRDTSQDPRYGWGWPRRVRAQYAYADALCTKGGEDRPVTEIELAAPDHWQDGDPDPDCPYRRSRRPEDWYLWQNWWEAWEPWCPYYHRDFPIWDYNYWEFLDVQLTYQFMLQVPYASRFLGDRITVSGLTGKAGALTGNNYAAEIQALGSLSNEGGPELWPQD